VSKVLDFIKGNLIIVISVVLILALLPTGYVFSGKWNSKVQTKVKEAYDKEKRGLTSSGRVNYALPAVLEGEQDISESRAPNTAVTNFYKQAKDARIAQVNEVAERGEAFNQGDHVELVPGLLPEAPDPRTRARLGRAMSEAIAGTQDSPSVYRRKLQRLNAGSPPNPETLVQTIEQIKVQLEQEFKSANADGNMTDEQKKRLEDALTARRLSAYIGQAKSLTFFCDTSAIVNGSAAGETTTVTREGYSIIPATNWSPSQITESVAFTWLWDYWIVSDILDAAALANSNAASGAMSVPEAPVKRIDRIRVSGLDLNQGEAADAAGGGRAIRGGAADPVAEATASITGREPAQPGSPYDLRTVEVVAVVSSKDLPKFIDAIGKVNFMTVLDLDMESVDVWEELQEGYYYGEDHVVRVSMTIETVWLRSWVAPLMPNPVKEALGVPVTQALGDPEG
tara:strand:+ start:124 stop:1485 length:1362 start_codon:yes stop_codon:yes gene_type:complete